MAKTDFITWKPVGQFTKYTRHTEEQLTKRLAGKEIVSVFVMGGSTSILFTDRTFMQFIPDGDNIEVEFLCSE